MLRKELGFYEVLVSVYSLAERQDLRYVMTEVTSMLRDVLGVRDLFSKELYYNSEFA